MPENIEWQSPKAAVELIQELNDAFANIRNELATKPDTETTKEIVRQEIKNWFEKKTTDAE